MILGQARAFRQERTTVNAESYCYVHLLAHAESWALRQLHSPPGPPMEATNGRSSIEEPRRNGQNFYVGLTLPPAAAGGGRPVDYGVALTSASERAR